MPVTIKNISDESSAAAGVLYKQLLKYTEQGGILKISLVDGIPVSQLFIRTAPWYLSFVPVHVGLLLHIDVHTSMHRDHGIVISLSTARMRLDFHLCF